MPTMPTGVATSTLENLLANTFTAGLDMVLYVLGFIWPYIMVVGIVYLFWRLGKRIFYVR